MAELKDILVPDIGADSATVTEILVAVGDTISAEQGLISVEGDKAAMEVPAPCAGVVKEICVKVGDAVSQGTLIIKVEAAGAAPVAEAPKAAAAPAPAPVAAPAAPAPAAAPAAAAPAPAVAGGIKPVLLPDIGADSAQVTEILVKVGDSVELDQGLASIEGDKAAMEVPAPFAGVVKSIAIKVGDSVSQGTLILELEVAGSAPAAAPAPVAAVPAPAAAPAPVAAPAAAAKAEPVPFHPSAGSGGKSGVAHASPSVRRLAREFGVDLSNVSGTGPKNRILKEDVQSYVKAELAKPRTSASPAVSGGGLAVLAAPKVDFAKFGPITEQPLSRIQKISGPSLHRNWVTIPHVTQFDEADISELEAFRKEQNSLLEKQKADVKVTPLVFILKAAAKALEQHPKFCSSLSHDGESLILKNYIHIGVAVDTPNGLVVPVVRDVNKKGIIELSRELGEISKKARAGKLTANDMSGGCFTISSLGGIGGTQFTPIVNAPEVAILGVSKSDTKPVWDGKQFQPRLMLPLALSYDHRVIDGADGARFITTLSGVLSDIRRLVM
ncbi:MAG: dihydrolipoyllysine-residue acetyltransferase [Gammaproteobacteria bacterium]|nr:dihydrolipoyllysine-residue acetyltransferase [Gammaproteobacteria bacterium]